MEFLITDMSCAHCAGQITKAIVATDASANVRIDVEAKTAFVTTTAGNDAISSAIIEAGYTPVLQAG
jgi:copper chaperone CopZ